MSEQATLHAASRTVARNVQGDAMDDQNLASPLLPAQLAFTCCSAISYTWSMRQLALGISNVDSAEASLEMTVSRLERHGLGKEQRMPLVGMPASRMTIADFEETSQASCSTESFTVVQWRVGRLGPLGWGRTNTPYHLRSERCIGVVW